MISNYNAERDICHTRVVILLPTSASFSRDLDLDPTTFINKCPQKDSKRTLAADRISNNELWKKTGEKLVQQQL